MTSQFYNSIIDDEKKIFNIKDEAIKKAAEDVANIYSSNALKIGSTFLDYNIPANRCAYLYKFAVLHTGIVATNFKDMISQQAVRNILEVKKELKICCLGGGPGTDIVGIIRTLASFPSFSQKVNQVTVLDICGGWRNSFKHIISRLKHGKVENVPAKFIDSNNFKADLIEVNLLGPLPVTVAKTIANADIICMVKFVSAILGKPESVNALNAIGEKIKLGAMVLFIDNFHKTKFALLEDISQQTGLGTVLGPLYKPYKQGRSNSKKDIYGCKPVLGLRFTVIGWVKTISTTVIENKDKGTCALNISSQDDENWDTESESEDSNPVPFQIISRGRRNNSSSISICNKFTQTDLKYLTFTDPVDVFTPNIDELLELVEALGDLCKVIKRNNELNNFQYPNQESTDTFSKQPLQTHA